jgi:hypothetical protein
MTHIRHILVPYGIVFNSDWAKYHVFFFLNLLKIAAADNNVLPGLASAILLLLYRRKCYRSKSNAFLDC